MTDMFQRGQAWLASQLTAYASRQVVYRRGETEATINATIGKTDAEQDSGDGLILKTEIRDYLIDVAELLLGGTPITPERGDRIIETDAASGKTFTFEVLPIGNQRPWRYSDPYRLKFRIHTRLISTEDA